MARTERLLLMFGVAAAVVFIANTTILGMLLPGYDPVSQTISEIGERGSRFEFAFRVGQLAVATCLLIFAVGVGRHSSVAGRSVVPALFLAFCGVTLAGTAEFEAPHPLHNLFGIAMMLGYMAPLVLAISWPDTPDTRWVRRGSIVLGTALVIGIAYNFSPLFVDYAPADFVRAHYGAIQRLVHLPFYGWCGFLAIRLLAIRTRLE